MRHTLRAESQRLYFHRTDGGAEYLCSCRVPDTDEGAFEGSDYIVRLDGQPEIRVSATVAAAPELLAACQALSAWATRECLPMGGPSDGPWDVVDAAIAKAQAD